MIMKYKLVRVKGWRRSGSILPTARTVEWYLGLVSQRLWKDAEWESS